MKIAFTRTAGCVPALLILGASVAAAGMPAGLFPSSALAPLIWLLAAAGAACLLLRHGIDLDDRARDMAARLCLEQKARGALEATLADTQAVLTRIVRQQEGVRDAERSRIARELDGELGQTLLALRAEMALLQVASCGIHPATHQKTTAMIGTLDLALRALRGLAGELRPLAPGDDLARAIDHQLAEFTRLNGIGHRFEIAAQAAPLLDAPILAESGLDALLYLTLQEMLADISRMGRATAVSVRLGRSATRLALWLEDDGGVDAAGARLHAGLRERLRAAGGALQVEPGPDGGSRVAVTLPGTHGLVPG